jgi:hypothetical protein
MPNIVSGAKPRLYQAPSSYYSMIARLALAEGGIAYEPVFVDSHVRKTQQPEPRAIPTYRGDAWSRPRNFM